MTNNEDIYIKSDGYTDHGHDHQGADRGADLHPFLDQLPHQRIAMRRWPGADKKTGHLSWVAEKKLPKHYVHT